MGDRLHPVNNKDLNESLLIEYGNKITSDLKESDLSNKFPLTISNVRSVPGLNIDSLCTFLTTVFVAAISTS